MVTVGIIRQAGHRDHDPADWKLTSPQAAGPLQRIKAWARGVHGTLRPA
jgi:hypothetical protein